MIDLLKELYQAYCNLFGSCQEETSNKFIFWFLFSAIVLIFLKGLYNLVKKAILWRNQKLLNKDLHPYYSYSDVERTTKYFVPLNYQILAPSVDKELGSDFMAVPKEKIIPFFIKKAFKKGGDDNRFYLVLADSGMGKTTFLINLYLKYKNSFRFFFSPKKYNIKLFPLGFPNILEDIKTVENKGNTILLLDAFDEDIEAVKDYKTRLNLILQEAHKFREIVITCRTQFFPSDEEIPNQTGYMSAGERGEYRFQKSYLSVFDDKDINRYLKKRFSIFQPRKRKRAKKIVQKSPTLVVRPMLLSHIEELVGLDREYEFSFQIYEEMIKKWIIREARKPKVSSLYGSEEIAIESLHQFTQKLAVHLYQNRGENNSYVLPINTTIDYDLLNELKIPEVSPEFLERIAKGKSLLNRDAQGNYKFSHKSILEYYLAKEFFTYIEFYKSFDFQGMDACKSFSHEILLVSLRNMEKHTTLSLYINSKSKFHKQNLNKISSSQLILTDELSYFYIGKDSKMVKSLIMLKNLKSLHFYAFAVGKKIRLLILAYDSLESNEFDRFLSKSNEKLSEKKMKLIKSFLKILKSNTPNSSPKENIIQFDNIILKFRDSDEPNYDFYFFSLKHENESSDKTLLNYIKIEVLYDFISCILLLRKNLPNTLIEVRF